MKGPDELSLAIVPTFFYSYLSNFPQMKTLGSYSCILYDIQAFLEMFRIQISILSTNEELYMNFAVFERLKMLC